MLQPAESSSANSETKEDALSQRGSRSRIAWRFFKMTGLLLVVSVLVFGVFGEILIAPARDQVHSSETALPVKPIELPTSSGIIRGWVIEAPSPKATVVLLHGLRGSRKSMLSRAELLYRHGCSIVMVDLHAHGESEGDAITFGFRERHGVAAAIRHARSLQGQGPFVVLGVSLGGASFLLADDHKVDGVILESVYPTIQEAVFDRVARKIGTLPATPVTSVLMLQLKLRLGIATSDLRPIDSMAKLDCPVLMMIGETDQHTTVAESRKMFAALPESADHSLWIVPDAAHVDLYDHQKTEYEGRVLSFLEQCR